MTREELQTLARAKHITVTTLLRWIRELGEDGARRRERISYGEAGRMGRKVNGDTWGWDSRPPRQRYQSRGMPYDW